MDKNESMRIQAPFLCLVKTLIIGVFALAPSLYASAEPSLPIGTRTDKLVAQISEVGEQMRRGGRLTTRVSVEAATLQGSNGSAMYNTATGTCELKVTAQATGSEVSHSPAGYESNPLFARFMAFHEFSHCELFERPTGMFDYLRGTGISDEHLRMADDLVALDVVESREGIREGLKVSLVTLTHEVYADARAVLFLLQDGVQSSDLEFVVAMRSANPMDRLHDSAPVLALLLRLPAEYVQSLSVGDVDRVARKLAVEQALKRTIAGADRPEDKGEFLAVNLRFQIEELYAMLKEGHLNLTQDYLMGASLLRPESLKQYPGLVWLSGRGAALARVASVDEFFAAWARERYSTTVEGFTAAAKAVGVAVTADSIHRDAPSVPISTRIYCRNDMKCL